jgi:hypothetical protein
MVENRFINTLGYGAAQGYTRESHFSWPIEGEWTPGYACSFTKVAYPTASNGNEENMIWDNSLVADDKGEKWRHLTVADRLCWNGKNQTTVETTLASKTSQDEKSSMMENPEFKLGCKVPDHNGPLAEGNNVNLLLYFIN